MKTLVAYFSATGTTAAAAQKLSNAAQAELYEIKPVVPYTLDDLDWRNPKSRSTVEMKNLAFRPEMICDLPPMNCFDTIYVGFPIWWYIAPTIINTFLESFDTKGKNIILFATSGGSGFGKTCEFIQNSCPEALVKEGFLIHADTTSEEIKEMLLNL